MDEDTFEVAYVTGRCECCDEVLNEQIAIVYKPVLPANNEYEFFCLECFASEHLNNQFKFCN